jgi:lysyl-tRNA synthetase class 2
LDRAGAAGRLAKSALSTGLFPHRQGASELLPNLTKPSPWWRRDKHQDRRPFLMARSRIQAAIRTWFQIQGFVEVDTAILQVSPGNETHLSAFATELVGPDGARSQVYLHTSPEFACKKLLAAGEERIFTFAPVFRNRERGPLHHPAFTMLEWYRVGEPYEKLLYDCTALVHTAAEAIGSTQFVHAGRKVDPYTSPECVTVAQAFERFAGIDLLATLGAATPDRDALARAAGPRGIRTAPDDTWADVFSRILIEKVEPNISEGWSRLLTEYPACLSALARPKPGDPRVAERFELYACGVELANAFGEPADPAEQRRRLEAEMAEKERRYGERYPVDEDFLAALEHMPPAVGAALGFDRLVMLATGATDIEQVIWTPIS